MATPTASVSPHLINWAIDRSTKSDERIAKAVGTTVERLRAWKLGDQLPTFRQIQKLANATHVPLGYLYLSQPPQEPLPIADFQTLDGEPAGAISPELRESIESVQRKQQWYREYRIELGEGPLAWTGRFSTSNQPAEVAESIRETLDMEASVRSEARTPEQYLNLLMERAELAGISVIRTSVARGNTHRPLEVSEFRGFSVYDPYAPFVFLNGADARAAQIFSLAHELAHLWVGESGISNPSPSSVKFSGTNSESWCNKVAAETLLPAEEFRSVWRLHQHENDRYSRVGTAFRVRAIAAAIRAFGLEFVDRSELDRFFAKERERWALLPRSKGGNYRLTVPVRNGRRFTDAVLSAASERAVLSRDAAHLLDVTPKFIYQSQHDPDRAA